MPKPIVTWPITDPSGLQIGTASNQGTNTVQPSAGIPISVSKSATGVVIGVHGTVAGTSVVFDNQLSK